MDYGLLLELHALTLATCSYALLPRTSTLSCCLFYLLKSGVTVMYALDYYKSEHKASIWKYLETKKAQYENCVPYSFKAERRTACFSTQCLLVQIFFFVNGQIVKYSVYR